MAEPKLSIKQMKESIREAGLPTADLLERADIDARYAEAVARLAEAEQLKTGEKLAKRARTEPAERDWRATLFVWRGDWEVRMPAVAAVGLTPFGRFVSLGVIEGGGTERVKDEHGEYNFRHQPRMTLARRYIADDDPRAAWASPAAVLDACLDDAPLALADIPAKLPWKVGA